MASKGRNMWLSSIAIKYTLIDIVVFDYTPFPTYKGGHKNNENFFLERRGAVLPSAPAWYVYVTALRISWPSGVLEERSIGSV